MKKYLLLAPILIFLFSCTKKGEEQPYTPTGFSVQVQQNTLLSTGQPVAGDVPCIIFAWKADGKDFDLTNTHDMQSGYLLDKKTNVSVKYDYGETGIMSEKVSVGHYFVFVWRTDGTFAYSYTYFDVSQNNYLELKKVFTTHATRFGFEAWNQTE